MDALPEMSGWWLEAVLVWLALLGVTLWLLGTRLVRPVLGLIGLIGGAALAAAFVESRFPGAVAWPWAIAGAAVGGIFGWGLWRLLMAALLGAAVAGVMLAAVMLWSDIPPPPLPEGVELTADEAAVAALADVPEDEDEVKEDPAGTTGAMTRAMLSVAEPLVEAWREWWASLSSGHQWLLTGAALGAGTLALLVGLALPRLASALVTAMLGVVLISPAVARWAPAGGDAVMAWVPSNGRQYVLVLIGATVIGALLQWAFFRKSADK